MAGSQIKLFCDSEEPSSFEIKEFNKLFHKFWCSPPFGEKSHICHLNTDDDKVTTIQLQVITVSGVMPITDSSSVIRLRPTGK